MEEHTGTSESYARKWHLREVRFEYETANSTFYACQTNTKQTALLKVLAPSGLEVERGGFELLSKYGREHAVEIFHHDIGAAVMQRLAGPRLLDVIDEGGHDEALDIQFEITERLLEVGVEIPGLKTIDILMEKSLKMGAEDVPDWAAATIQRAQHIASDMLGDRCGWCALHGDLHPRNIIQSDGAWKVIDARGVTGPAAFEFSNLFINPWDRKDLIFQPGRMASIVRRVSEVLACDRQLVVSCAIANALFYTPESFAAGYGRHPVKCIEQLLKLF